MECSVNRMFRFQGSVDHAPLQEHPVDVIHGAAVAENSEKRATRVERDLIWKKIASEYDDKIRNKKHWVQIIAKAIIKWFDCFYRLAPKKFGGFR